MDDLDLSPETVQYLISVASGPEDRDEIVSLLEDTLPFMSPAKFAKRADDTFLVPPHIAFLDRALEDLVCGRLGTSRLIVTMPPRHGKSELCSKFLPAWFLSRYPDRRVILTSYEADFAAGWGRKARDVLQGAADWCGVKIRQDSKAANRWNLVGHKGGMETAGARGPITGKGAHLLIIDDPIKTSEDAMSETLRQKTWDWYISTAKTRLEPGAFQIVIMTRWNEDDLVGRLLEHEPDQWTVINFPAIAEEADEIGRQPGDALWPGAYSIEALEEIRDTPETGYWWSALYQQHPTAAAGGMFARDNFRHWTHAPGGAAYVLDGLVVPVKDTVRFQTVDLAASKRTKADFTVVSTWAVTKTEPANLILLDRFRGRVEAPEHLALIEEHYRRWSSDKMAKVRFVGVGRQTYGLAVLQEAVRKGHYWLRGEDEDNDKYSRAIPAGQLVQNHLAWFPKDASWLEEWEAELLGFGGGGAHDDQVDTFSLAALEYGRRRRWAPRPAKDEPGTTEEKIWAQLKDKRRRARLHPMLGRW